MFSVAFVTCSGLTGASSAIGKSSAGSKPVNGFGDRPARDAPRNDRTSRKRYIPASENLLTGIIRPMTAPKPRRSESVVAAGEPLMDLGDPADVEVIVDLLSTDAVRVAPQGVVRVEGWGGETPLAGHVRRIEPSAFVKVSALGVEERRVNVIVDLDLVPHDCKLGDGYKVEARIVVWAGTAVTVPLGSLFRRGAEWAVFVVDNGRASLRPVTIGERNAEVAQVLKGLELGDRVVLHPPDTLADGGRLAIR